MLTASAQVAPAAELMYRFSPMPEPPTRQQRRLSRLNARGRRGGGGGVAASGSGGYGHGGLQVAAWMMGGAGRFDWTAAALQRRCAGVDRCDFSRRPRGALGHRPLTQRRRGDEKQREGHQARGRGALSHLVSKERGRGADSGMERKNAATDVPKGVEWRATARRVNQCGAGPSGAAARAGHSRQGTDLMSLLSCPGSLAQ